MPLKQSVGQICRTELNKSAKEGAAGKGLRETKFSEQIFECTVYNTDKNDDKSFAICL